MNAVISDIYTWEKVFPNHRREGFICTQCISDIAKHPMLKRVKKNAKFIWNGPMTPKQAFKRTTQTSSPAESPLKPTARKIVKRNVVASLFSDHMYSKEPDSGIGHSLEVSGMSDSGVPESDSLMEIPEEINEEPLFCSTPSTSTSTKKADYADRMTAVKYIEELYSQIFKVSLS